MKAKAGGTRKTTTRSAPKALENLKTKPSCIKEESEEEEELESEEERRNRRPPTQSKNRTSDAPVIIVPHKPKLMPYVSVPPTSGKCTLSPRRPRTAQDVLETQRHKASQVAPRAKSKMLTSLRHPGSFLGHPGPSWATLRYVSLAIFRIFSCLSYFSHFSKFK